MKFFIFVIVLKLLFNVIFVQNVVFASGFRVTDSDRENLSTSENQQSEPRKTTLDPRETPNRNVNMQVKNVVQIAMDSKAKNPESLKSSKLVETVDEPGDMAYNPSTPEALTESVIHPKYAYNSELEADGIILKKIPKGIADLQFSNDDVSEITKQKDVTVKADMPINRQALNKLENLDLTADESVLRASKIVKHILKNTMSATKDDDKETDRASYPSLQNAYGFEHLASTDSTINQSNIGSTKVLPKVDFNSHLSENSGIGQEELLHSESIIHTPLKDPKVKTKEGVPFTFTASDADSKFVDYTDLTVEESHLVPTGVLSIDSGHVSESKSGSFDLRSKNTAQSILEPQISIILEENESQETETDLYILQPLVRSDEIDLQNLHHFQALQKRTKDTLSLEYIEESVSFKWNQTGVEEWLQFRHDNQELLIGRRLTELVIVHPESKGDKTARIVNVGTPISALECYSFWNFELYQEEGVIIVANQDKVLWFGYEPVLEKFELSWQWCLRETITRLIHFQQANEDYLIVALNQNTIQIYKFLLESHEFKIIQDIFFLHKFNDFVLLNCGLDIVLAVSEIDLVTFYFMDSRQNSEFRLKQTVVATGVKSLTSFTIGGKSYLALTGYPSQILLYQQGVFKVINTLGSHFGLVDYFLPIPLKIHQDDLILLVAYKQQDHMLITNLLWNGDSFESGLPVPCHSVSKVSQGLECLLDSQGAKGEGTLHGSSLFGQDDNIFLITPSTKGISKIYQFHFEMLLENSEFLNLVGSFETLYIWFEKQHNMMAQIEDFLATPEEELLHRIQQREISSLDYVETPEFHFTGDVSEIYLNDHLWSEEDSNIDLNILIDALEEIEKSLASTRQRRDLDLPIKVEYDQLIYDQVTVEELEIEQLNGEEFYINQGILKFPGEIIFSSLEVLNQAEVGLQKRELGEDFLLEGDLEFDVINDIKWVNFKRDVVLRNQEQELESLKVEGEIIVEDILNIKSLNSLNFPEDYLLANGPRSSVVLAEKTFVNNLTADAVDTEGLINGQNPVEAITLMDHQQWQGFPTFNHLEVSEKLELHGSAHGRNVDSSPSNPTLQESNVIEADCVFNQLQVNGPIVLKGDLSGKPLAELLNNIIQRPQDPRQECEVPASKTFQDVTFPIDFELQNNTINRVAVEKFMTTHTSQTLELDYLDGYVYFYNLTLTGLYDGINLTEVLHEVILLDKPVDLGSTQLTFDEKPLQAHTLIVLQSLNGLPLDKNLQTTNEDLVIDSAMFESLGAKMAEFSSDILGPGKLNKIELEAFVKDRLWHQPPIQGNIFLQELIVPQGIQADELHGINSEYLLEFLQQIDELPEMVLNGQIQVNHITVTGNVQLQKINGLMFDEDLQMSAIWLNRQNHLTTTLTFQNPVEVKGNLNVLKYYQGRNLTQLIKDMIFKDANETILITAPKSFLNPVRVSQNSIIQAINGQAFENLALKTVENTFKGSVKIKGSLNSPQLEVLGSVTGINLKHLENTLYYDPQLYNFVIKDTVTFENPMKVKDLTVLGDYNDFPQLADFFENLIFKSGPYKLCGNNTFTGRVTVEQGLNVQNINGHDIEAIFNNLIFTQSPDPIEILSPISFQSNINVNKVIINTSLKTSSLSECPLEEWLNNTLRVDHDQNIPHYLQFATGSLDGNSLNVHFINSLDLAKIVTLNTPQIFKDEVEFSDVILRDVIKANGSVNGMNLEEEYNNTLMIYGGQHVTTPLVIQSIEVLQDLEIHCYVNNHNMSDVATLDENLELRSPVYFNSLYSPQLVIKDLVTGIDFDKWFERSIKIQGKPTQHVTGKWSTRTLTVKTGPHEFQYAINGFQPWQYNRFLRTAPSYKSEEEDICGILKDIWRKLKQKSVAIKYIEEDFVEDLKNLTSSSKRHKLFNLKSENRDMLLLNVDCWSYFLKWNSSKPGFEILNSYESGYIDQITMLTTGNFSSLKFVTNFETTESMNCSVKGLNMWSSLDNVTKLERFFGEDISDFYRSKSLESSLLILSKNKIKELNLLTAESKERWQVPVTDTKDNDTSYRFLAQEDSENILITNGVHTISLTDEEHKKSKKEISDSQGFLMHIMWSLEENTPDLELETSVLRPNSSMARQFIFSDFKQTLQRILLDVVEELNQQINIVQLTIPESDLYDEHLITDFITVMDQIEQQTIYSKEVMDINFGNINIPENPAQVLATRVLLTVWPKIEELQEIHGYLKDNQNHDHPLCLNITQTLGSLINQVLKKAYLKETKDYNGQLTEIIKIIRNSENDLQKTVQLLQNGSEIQEGEFLALGSSQKLSVLPLPVENYKSRSSEIITLKVGSVNSSHQVLAIAKTHYMATPGPDSFIYLHAEHLADNPFQIIPASKPHSLIHLRLGAETLLMYVENCCQVQVLRYQGTRGFLKFTNFLSDSEIQQLLVLALPQEEKGLKHFLILLTNDNMKFYEIVLEGTLYDPPDLPCP